MLSEISQTKNRANIAPRIDKFMETESGIEVPEAGGQVKGCYCLKGTEFMGDDTIFLVHRVVMVRQHGECTSCH